MGRAVVGQQPALLAVHDDGFPASRQLRGCAVTSQAGFRHLSSASCSLWPRFTPQIAFLSKSPEYKGLSSTLRLPAVTHCLSLLGFFLSVQQKAASQGRCPRSAPFVAHSQPSSRWGDLRGRFQTPHARPCRLPERHRQAQTPTGDGSFHWRVPCTVIYTARVKRA